MVLYWYRSNHRVGLKGADFSTNPDDVRTAGERAKRVSRGPQRVAGVEKSGAFEMFLLMLTVTELETSRKPPGAPVARPAALLVGRLRLPPAVLIPLDSLRSSSDVRLTPFGSPSPCFP